ncbi:hypothetical protein ASD65_12720 [Microbacterium sp. Root61]|uniref:hypothetical protein n=1 Tax=Microbacterium sp. Root61 TaxID=1736570 RepID=UPI0006FD5237|nr:hypothetical protein [Microbacterium sp. Root61]KRA25188.1 hypothetical protein ASD65_12720 [Microbacterium sp. Root61]
MSGTVSSFDPTPLVEPVDRAAVQEYTRRLRAQGGPGSAGGLVTAAATVFAVVLFLFVFISVATSVIGTTSFGASGTGPRLTTFLPVVLIALVVGYLGWRLLRFRGGVGVRRYRLDRFARANGMTYVPVLNDPSLPGMIFGQGGGRQAVDLVRGTKPRFVEFGNYRYTTGSGKNRTTHRWGYVAVRLDVPLPHIVLDALSNNSLFGSNLPIPFDRDQRLSLEGDFDKSFALYSPRGYEGDALYLFTPDIMARFIDNAAAMDVEIVDDWLFLYAKRDFSTLDPATWAWLFSVVGALLDKLAQWGRWRDERLETEAAARARIGRAVGPTDAAGPAAASALPFSAPTASLRPPPGVAAEGRRLRRGMPVITIVITVLFVAVWLFIQLGGFTLLYR